MSEHICDEFQKCFVQLDAKEIDWNQLTQSAAGCEDCQAQIDVLRLLHEDAQKQRVHLDSDRMEQLRNAVKPNSRRFIPLTLAAAAAVLVVFIVLSNTGPEAASGPTKVMVRTPPVNRVKPTHAEINELAEVEPMDKRLHIIQRRAMLDFDFGAPENRNDSSKTTSKRMKRLRKRMRALRSELTSG